MSAATPSSALLRKARGLAVSTVSYAIAAGYHVTIGEYIPRVDLGRHGVAVRGDLAACDCAARNRTTACSHVLAVSLHLGRDLTPTSARSLGFEDRADLRPRLAWPCSTHPLCVILTWGGWLQTPTGMRLRRAVEHGGRVYHTPSSNALVAWLVEHDFALLGALTLEGIRADAVEVERVVATQAEAERQERLGSVTATLVGGRVQVRSAYDAQIVDAIRGIDGRLWDGMERAWTIPVEGVPQLVWALDAIGARTDDLHQIDAHFSSTEPAE